MIFREATIDDINGLSVVRMSVKENVLHNPLLVTREDYTKYLSTHGKGWLCEIDTVILVLPLLILPITISGRIHRSRS